MKSFFTLINLLICFELIIAPLVPNLRLLTSDQALAQGSCRAGLTWNSNLKRCIAPDQSARAMNHAKECEAETDPTAKTNCYRDFAEAEKNKNDGEGKLLGEAESTFDNMQITSTIVNGLGVALVWAVLINAWKKNSTVEMNKCASISYVAITAGILAMMGGDALANFQHGSRLDDIEKSWEEEIGLAGAGETDLDNRRQASTEAQKKAFYVLAKQEKSLADAFQMKSYFYGGAAVAFATAFGFAAYEQWSANGSAYCGSNDGQAPAEPAPTTPPATPPPAAAPPATPPPAAAPPATPPPAAAPPATPPPAGGGGVDIPGAKGLAPRYHENEQRVWQFDNLNASNTDWESEVMKQKHANNIDTAVDMASYYILTKAFGYKNSSPSIEEYESIKKYTTATQMDKDMEPEGFAFLKMAARTMLSNIAPIQTAHAEDLDCSEEAVKTATHEHKAKCKASDQNFYAHMALWGSLGGGLVVGTVVGLLAGEGFGKTMITPTARMWVSGLLAGWAVAMVIWLQVRKGKALEREKLLKKMGDDFAQTAITIQDCKSADRNDPGKPNCYCYTAEGSRNPGRGNSKICLDLWGGNLDFGEGNYLGGGGAPKGCIDSNGQPDQKCACRKSSRKCLKATPNNIGALNLGSFKMLASGLAPVDKLGSGNFNAAKVSSGDLAQQAMKIMRANKKLLKDPKLKGVADKVNKQIRLQSAKVNSELAKVPPVAPSAPPSSPAAAIAAIEKELKANKEAMQGAIGPTGGVAAGAAKPEFGMDEEDLAIQDGQIAEAMKQDLDYGQNDISTGKNIFETLSNRYQRSGMRRLFDEEGKTKADKPAESDIAQ